MYLYVTDLLMRQQSAPSLSMNKIQPVQQKSEQSLKDTFGATAPN